jgi:ribosomal-protein-serine acetyltransferase
MIDVSKISWRSGKAWISYWLSEEFQGKGLVTNAARAIVGHLFALGLNRVELYAQPDNLRSRAVADRLGFRPEGTLREIIGREGSYTDRVVHSLLPDEWAGNVRPLSFAETVAPDVEVRLPQPWDAEELYKISAENQDYLRPWLRWAEEQQSVETSRGFLVHSMHALADNSEVVWTVWYKGEIAGLVGTSAIDWRSRKIEVGYWLGEGFEGKGLMSAALRRMLDHLFGTLDLHRVELYINPKNEPSRTVAKRFGFTHEATLRRFYLSDGALVDMEVHGLLQSEWMARKSS